MSEDNSVSIDFEVLFQAMGTAYIVFKADDPDFTIIGENEAHAKIAMVKRKDVIGKPVLEAFPDTTEDFITKGESHLVNSLRKVIATGKPDTMHNFAYDIKDEHGVYTPKFWEVTHYPVFQDGKVIAVCQQTNDITETISARRELTIAQDHLERALSYGEVGTWMWDVVQDVVLGDKNLARLFGIGDGSGQVEVSMKRFVDAIHPDDVKQVMGDIETALAKKLTTYESEFRTFDFTGNTRWLLARGHIEYDDRGDAVRFPGVVMDITERKLAEDRLHIMARANTQFPASMGYKKTLESITAMIVPNMADWCAIDLVDGEVIDQVVVTHKDPQKVKWAKQLRKEQGPVSLQDPTGVPWVIRTGKIEHVPVITDQMLVAAAKNDQELKLLRDIGFQSVIIVPLKIDGKIIGAVTFISTESHRHYNKDDVEIAQALANRVSLGVYNANLFRDAETEIKERKKLQAKLEELNGVLEDRVKRRTLQLEKMNQGLQEEIERRHKIENQRLQHYVDLNKTKDEFISLASHQLRTPATGVKQYIGMVLEGMAGDVVPEQEKLLEKAYQSNERQLTIVSDLLKVAQLDAGKVKLRHSEVDFTELVKDVVKEQQDTYRMRRQKVDLRVPETAVMAEADSDKIRMVLENIVDNASKYSDPGKTISVELLESHENVEVVIKDKGVGIASKDIDKLFEKFNRIHNHLSNHVGGTGLGLYWAKKVVDLHGGDITVTSVLDEGSTFRIVLPKEHKKSVASVKKGAMNER